MNVFNNIRMQYKSLHNGNQKCNTVLSFFKNRFLGNIFSGMYFENCTNFYFISHLSCITIWERNTCAYAMQHAQEAKLEKQALIPHRFDRHKLTLEQGVTALRTRRREEGAIMCVVDHQFLMPLTPSSSLQCVELHIIFIVLQK